MSCPDPSQPDFFNNVAAVAVVLMFAKVVTHRSRAHAHAREPSNDAPSGRRAFFHGLAVVAAVVAAGVAIWATAAPPDGRFWHWFAGGSLLLAGAILLVEVFFDDVRPAWKGTAATPGRTPEKR